MCEQGTGLPQELTESKIQTAKKGGEFLVNHINKVILKDLIPEMCAEYELGTIQKANFVSTDRISIIFTTKPNNASFEADLRIIGTEKFEVFENVINRISLYGRTSDCIKTLNLKNFCYCV